MSAKDTIVDEILKKITLYAVEHYDRCNGYLVLSEGKFLKVANGAATKILSVLPKLDKKEVKKLAIKLLVDKYSPAGYAEKDIDEIVDQICSLVPEPKQMRSMTKEEIKKEEEYDRKHYQVYDLVPEHKWVQTTDDKGNVIVPLDEVVATGELINEVNINNPGDDSPKVWICDVAKKLIDKEGQSGTLYWVPDKEDK